MQPTDWIRFAELVAQIGRLIEAGRTASPEFIDVVTEAQGVLNGGDELDSFEVSFPDAYPWSMFEAGGREPALPLR